MIRNNILVISLICLLCLSSCQSKTETPTASYNIELVEAKKLTLPVDENTYYMSRSMFQIEENNKEYLYFGNFEKTQYEILVYDLKELNLHKRIPLLREGPNAALGVRGCKPFEGTQTYFLFESYIRRLSIINDKGKIQQRYPVKLLEGQFTHCDDGWSYFYNPSFCIDSIIYFIHGLNKPQMKTNEWKEVSMFTSLNLKNGEVKSVPLHYPSIFGHDVENPAGGYKFTYDYNYSQDRLVCSFCGYDSIMV